MDFITQDLLALLAAGVVTGVGFLGAGVLVREGGSVHGLTTAASIWATAAVGMAIGGGAYDRALATLILALTVLWLPPVVERWLDDARESRVYRVVMSIDEDRFEAIEACNEGIGLRVRAHKHMKDGDAAICEWEAVGRHATHEELMETFMVDPAIRTVSFY